MGGESPGEVLWMVDNLERIGEILGAVGSPGCFTTRRTVTADDLQLEVQGLGRLCLPVSRAQAETRPARSLWTGEKTFLDRRVRDTWEIPRSRVKIDRRRCWPRAACTGMRAAIMRHDAALPAQVLGLERMYRSIGPSTGASSVPLASLLGSDRQAITIRRTT